jgi:hypothetical protein
MINKKLDAEVEPFKPVSKDHTRANRVGVNIEQLENMDTKMNFRNNQRKSLDMSTIKKKKLNPMHARKQSYAPDPKMKLEVA